MKHYSTLRAAEKLSLSNLCFFASFLFTLAVHGLFSMPLTTEKQTFDGISGTLDDVYRTKSCSCRSGPPGENCFDGLNDYASFELVVQSGPTSDIYPFPRPLSFGSRVVGFGDAIISQFPTNDSFLLLPGDYKISAGISTFGIMGLQLEVFINGIHVFNWPSTPTALNQTTFLEFTVLQEVTIPSILEVFITKKIPSHSLTDTTLLNYLNIEKLDLTKEL